MKEKVINREIKFRAWDGKRMVFFDTLLIGFKKSKEVIPQVYFKNDTFNGEVRLGYHEVMQFTGLSDKNGKEIYEGDILKYTYEDECFEYFPVIFKNGSYSAGYADSLENGYLGDDLAYRIFIIELAGNIYENPELITKGNEK